MMGECDYGKVQYKVGYFYELNWTDLKIQKTENSVSTDRFSKTNFVGLGTVFHVVSFTFHLPTWYDQQSKYFYSCCISALLVLSHFSWQLVGPIQHGSMSFLLSYHRGINERWRWQTNVKKRTGKTETAVTFVKLKPNRKPQFFLAKPNQSHFFASRTPLVLCKIVKYHILFWRPIIVNETVRRVVTNITRVVDI